MQLHFLMIGFGGKKIYLESALKTDAKISLLINRDKYKNEYEKLFNQVLVVEDIYNWKQLRNAIDQGEKIDVVLTRHENYVTIVGAINQYLGLDGIDYATSRNFCNKYLMKQKWLAAQVPCADGICLDNLNHLDEFLERHSFPLILKKTSAAHSNYVVKVKSKEDLFEKLAFLKSQVSGYVTSKPVEGYKHKSEDCQFLLEEMLYGRELTVDTFVSGNRLIHTPICEYVMAHELGLDDTYLPIRTMPTVLTKRQEKLVYQTVTKALNALSARNCVCHTEVFFDEKNNQYSVIESTPRGGGNRAEMTILTAGFDYSLAVFQTAAGLDIEEIDQPQRAISVVEYFADKKGLIKKIDLDFLYKNPAVSNIKIRDKIGDLAEQAKFGGKTIVSFYVEANDCLKSKNLAIQLFKQVKEAIKINYS